MEYNTKTKIITINLNDSLYDSGLYFFKQKTPHAVTFSYRNIVPFLEYLSRNNDGTIDFLLAIAELVMFQIQKECAADEYRLEKERLTLIHNTYTTAKTANSEFVKNSSNQALIFLVNKEDPIKTLDSIIKLTLQESQRLTDLGAQPKPEEKVVGQKVVKQKYSKPTKKDEIFEGMPELEVIPDEPPAGTWKGSSVISPSYQHDPNQSYTRNMAAKYNRPMPPREPRSEVIYKDDEETIAEESANIHTTKKQKYFSNKSIISLMRSATRARTATGNIEADMQSSKVLATDEVAFSIEKTFASITAEKPKLTYEDLNNSITRYNNIAQTKQTTSSLTSKFGILGKKFKNVVTNSTVAAHGAIDGKSIDQHRSDVNVWLENKTSTSRALANLSQVTKEKDKQLGFLGFIFSPMQYSRNSDAKSLVLKMRNIQRRSRNEKNTFDKVEWDKTIDKYKRYADEILKSSAAGKDADAARRKIMTAKSALESLVLENLQQDLVDHINQTIENLMDAGAALESAEVSYRPPSLS